MDITQVMAKAARNISRVREAEVFEGKLLDFAEYVWPVVEPAIPFVRGWVLGAIAEHLEAVTYGQIRRLLINVPPGFTKSLMTDVFWPAWEWGPRNMPWLRYMCAAYSNHLTERDNMRCRNVVISDRYRRLWGKRFGISNEQFTKVKFANDKTGWKLATSVAGIGTGERADRVIIDDPNNPMEMESEAIRDNINMWFTEVIPDRLNNQQESAIVVIQQRTHEDDVSGTALTREMGYTHLMIPMEYDSSRRCVTYLRQPDGDSTVFWEDPRKEEDELAWPERFPEEIVKELERDKGPYAWCNPGEAPVLMGDLSLKPIEEVAIGDDVIGFTIGNKERRAHLKPAKVLSISKTRQPVVRITLDSGHTIRCTANHKWWTGRNDKAHAPYAPAKLGSILSRVCQPVIGNYGPDDWREQRAAGWLAGFFDGEGSVTINRRREGEGSPLVTFSQGTGRNKPICDRLEEALTILGFNWSFWEKPNHSKAGGDHKIRSYWLKAAPQGRESRVGLYQQFLHIVQPIKWRDRLIEAATSGRLYTRGERVISIQPDRDEIVYGLETTTGNYVVWGLASSNSGQYQQSPEPRGGSILKRDFWQLWKEPKYPQFEFLLASLDTAYTAKEENDPSALTVWGVFREKVLIEEDIGSTALWIPHKTEADRRLAAVREGNPKIMLIYAWQERLQFNELIEKVIETCMITRTSIPGRSFPVDRLVVEAKAAGTSVGHELHRQFRGAGRFGVDLIDPTRYGDKEARVHAIQHLFSDGMIYAPDKEWADMVINQCALFPRGSKDDLVDSTSQALRYLREMGFALRREEHAVAEEEALRYRSGSLDRPLYGGL